MLPDGRGNVGGVIREGEAQVYDYTSFGELRTNLQPEADGTLPTPLGDDAAEVSQPAANTYTLAQKHLDTNSNLYYFGARYYDAATASWMTQDTYRGSITNPASQHRYLYNYASPVSFVDRDGYNPVADFFEDLQESIDYVLDQILPDAATGSPPNVDISEYTEPVEETKEYIGESGKQCVQGNYYEGDMTLLGLSCQVGTGVYNADLPLDIVDITYDIENWENTSEHYEKTCYDVIGVVPVVGGIKNIKRIEKISKNTDKINIITKNGTEITGFTKHGIDRAIGDLAKRKGVAPNDILDTLKNPKLIGDVIIDPNGRKQQKYFGKNAVVVINPDTGKIITIYPQ